MQVFSCQIYKLKVKGKNTYFHKQRAQHLEECTYKSKGWLSGPCFDSYGKDLHIPTQQSTVLQASKRIELWTKIAGYSFRDESSNLPHPFYAALEKGVWFGFIFNSLFF